MDSVWRPARDAGLRAVATWHITPKEGIGMVELVVALLVVMGIFGPILWLIVTDF